MKQHISEIIYIALLGMAFTFFAFVDDLGLTHTPRVKVTNQTCNGSAKVENTLNDYTYSPLKYVNGFN